MENDRGMDNELVVQAVGAMGNWFSRFDSDTKQWEKEAGLSGWRAPLKDVETT